MKYPVILLLGWCVYGVQAQTQTLRLGPSEVLATFEDASRLAIDGRNRLFVVDKGAEVVHVLSFDGSELARLGGPGSHDGEFDDPHDVDPGNGLTWLVADTGNGRLQRFSQTYLHLETLAVPREAHYEPGTPDRLEPRDDVMQSGRPVAVAQSPTGEVFSIEASEAVVLKWDQSRRLERTIGGWGAGEGRLVNPVALAVGPDQLYVADRALGSVLVYDLFGGWVQVMARKQVAAVRALGLVGTDLWIILPSQILVLDQHGRVLYEIKAGEGLDLVDAKPVGDEVLLLTSTSLIRASWITP